VFVEGFLKTHTTDTINTTYITHIATTTNTTNKYYLLNIITKTKKSKKCLLVFSLVTHRDKETTFTNSIQHSIVSEKYFQSYIIVL
jgi:hypothetical protein